MTQVAAALLVHMKPANSKLETRAREATEEIATMGELAHRLRAAIDAYDQNAESPLGIPNMALPIRLLACSGQGNQLLQRISEARGIQLSTISISEPPSENDELTLSVGSVPIDSDTPSAMQNSRTIGLNDFMANSCLLVDAGKDRISITWEQLLRAISEKRGYIHSDRQIPKYFDEIDKVGLADAKLVNFMFRNAAGVILNGCCALLRSLGIPDAPLTVTYKPATAIGVYGFAIGGIPFATLDQQAIDGRLIEACRHRAEGRHSLSIPLLRELANETKGCGSLFYRRTYATALLELGIAEFESGKTNTGTFLVSSAVMFCAGSRDPKLCEVAAFGRRFLYG